MVVQLEQYPSMFYTVMVKKPSKHTSFLITRNRQRRKNNENNRTMVSPMATATVINLYVILRIMPLIRHIRGRRWYHDNMIITNSWSIQFTRK